MPTGQKPPSGPEETPPPQVVGLRPDPLKAPRGIPSVAPKNMDPAYMQQQMMKKAMMGRGMMGQGPRPMANAGGRIRAALIERWSYWSRRKLKKKYRRINRSYLYSVNVR